MKILCVSQRFSPAIGGAEIILEQYLDFLSRNHQITVYTTNAYSLDSFWNSKTNLLDDKPKKSYDVKQYSILTPTLVPQNSYDLQFSVSSPGPFSPDMWTDLMSIKDRYDLIIVSAFPYDHIIPAFAASKKFGIPIVIIPFLHLQYPEYYLTGLRISLLAESDAVIVNTEHEKMALENLNIDISKIHLIPPGIETSPTLTNNTRSKFGISQDSLVVLFVGNMSTEKGVIHLIESLKPLWGLGHDIKLILIGSSTAAFDDYFKKQSKFLSNIRVLGAVSEDEKMQAFSTCDIFAMPSNTESFGLVYLESWRCKKPVIGCNIPAVNDLIDDGIDGILVEYGNISQLTDSIKKLTDSDLRSMMGKNGYQKLVTKYNIEKQCEKFEMLCESLV